MATKKDLVEAYSFSRRRLVTAFVSGAPGGREVEPARPGRTIVGGIALAVLLVAGAAVAGVLSPRTEVDWASPGLVISEEKGAPYVILDDDGDGGTVVRPVINITSAQLILGSAVEPLVVPQAEISSRSPGESIGILRAPATVPDASALLPTGWTACTADGAGVMTTVSGAPAASPTPGEATLVRSGGALYVVAEAPDAPGEEPRAHAYRLPPDAANNDNLLDGIGAPVTAQALAVPPGWLALVKRGGDLAGRSVALPGAGTRPDYAGSSGVPGDARVGDYYTIGDQGFVLTADGPAALDEFALAVYLNTSLGFRPRDLGLEQSPDLPRAPQSPYADAEWPVAALTPATGEPCLVLQTSAGEQPRARLATAPADGAAADALRPGRDDAAVASGRGAFVLSGSWDDAERGEPFLVDDRGEAYPMVGPDVVTSLGYDGYDPPVVPDSWVELFGDGVPLSVADALCPPARTGGTSCG